ncbi:hypothetical protein [Streptomyces olivochromogenes]|uniref:hypothetical protein n=1 Tax=Streptomyces olivochromogenes TaxID=1963 RepID=UPI003676E3E3
MTTSREARLDQVGQGRTADRVEDDSGPLACRQLTHLVDDVLLGGDERTPVAS